MWRFVNMKYKLTQQQLEELERIEKGNIRNQLHQLLDEIIDNNDAIGLLSHMTYDDNHFTLHQYKITFTDTKQII